MNLCLGSPIPNLKGRDMGLLVFDKLFGGRCRLGGQGSRRGWQIGRGLWRASLGACSFPGCWCGVLAHPAGRRSQEAGSAAQNGNAFEIS